MKPLRVLQFITPAGFYGAERWVIALANNLPGPHFVCDLAVTQESDSQDLSVAACYPPAAGEVHYLPMRGRFDIRVVKSLARVIRDRQIEVIHTHGYKSDIIGLLAARRAGIPCVSTPHGFSGNVGWKLGAFIRLGTFMLRYFDAVAPLSEELVRDMQRLRVPEARTRFIRNGVDLREVDDLLGALPASLRQPAADTATDSESQTIGFIGQLIARKGLPDLIRSFDELYAENGHLRLQILGEGRQREELETLAQSLSSADAVHFSGFCSDRLERLADFSLFVMTSSLEGIPRCMMEAMAVGIPVVAYDIPGVDQLIDHEQTGLLAPFGDRGALVAQCKRVLNSPQLAKSLADNARQRIHREYSAARMALEYEQLFLDVLDRQSDDHLDRSEAH